MNGTRVRPLRTNELDVALRAYEWLFEPPGARPESWEEERARLALKEAIEGDRSLVLVAESDSGELVGLVSAYLDLSSVRFGLRCWVEDLAVDPSRRSSGIGRALLGAARGWARENGATHLELDTGLARTDAQRFYERQEPVTKSYSYSWEL